MNNQLSRIIVHVGEDEESLTYLPNNFACLLQPVYNIQCLTPGDQFVNHHTHISLIITNYLVPRIQLLSTQTCVTKWIQEICQSIWYSPYDITRITIFGQEKR